jgi:hypothetical protein
MWRALETGFSLKIYAPALDPTGIRERLRRTSFFNIAFLLMSGDVRMSLPLR